MRKSPALLILALALLATTACDFVTDPDPLAAFAYNELGEGEVIEEFVNVTELGAEFVVLGELNTPTPCFRLEPDFDRSGNNITLRITGREQGTNCPAVPGAYRYQAVIRHLDEGTYDLRVIHTFPSTGQPTTEFNLSVTVS